MMIETNPHFHELHRFTYCDGRGINLAPANMVTCRVCGRVGRLVDGMVHWLTREEMELMTAVGPSRKSNLS